MPPPQVLPAQVPTVHWKQDMVDLLSPEPILVLLNYLQDDAPVIEERVGAKVEQRKMIMCRRAKKKMKNIKKDISNG